MTLYEEEEAEVQAAEKATQHLGQEATVVALVIGPVVLVVLLALQAILALLGLAFLVAAAVAVAVTRRLLALVGPVGYQEVEAEEAGQSRTAELPETAESEPAARS